MKLTKKMQEYYLQKKFFEENGMYFNSIPVQDDTEDIDDINSNGCLFFLITVFIISIFIIISLIKLIL